MFTSNGAMRAVFGKVCPSVHYCLPDAGVVDGVVPLVGGKVPAQRTSSPHFDLQDLRVERGPAEAPERATSHTG
jgi:hypothetical protein